MDLIPFSPSHFPVLYTWFENEQDIVQWGGPLLHYPLDESQLHDIWEESQVIPPKRLSWMASHENRLVGHAELSFDWRNGNATLGRVVINPPDRGRHLADPMLKLVMGKAFDYPEIIRLELNVYTFNQNAILVYEQLGFVHEGVRRSSVLVDGKRWDTAVMAIVR